MEDVRLIAKGSITDLSKGFALKGGVPFSVYVRSKGNTMLSDTLLECRLIGDKAVGALPVPIGDWTPAMIAYISPNAIDLGKFDVYWGASEQPNKIV
jgi:hypothetical protein|nr:MAG: hypothetical protein [Bacteriophage sp.]